MIEKILFIEENSQSASITTINVVIAATNVSELLSAARTRVGIILINTSEDNLYFNFGSPASSGQGSFILTPGETYTSELSNPPGNDIYIFGIENQTYTFMEW